MAKNPLNKYTVQQLQEELNRRLGTTNRNKDYYYWIVDKEDHYDDNEFYQDKQVAVIVHKRFWHLNGHSDDDCISRWLDLPKDFNEVQESAFIFKAGSVKEAVDRMKSLGFEYLPNTIVGQEGDCNEPHSTCFSSVQSVKLLESFRVDCNVPEKLKKAYIEWVDKNREINSIEKIKISIEKWAKSKKCIVHYQYSDKYYIRFSIIEKEVFDKLPSFPQDDE